MTDDQTKWPQAGFHRADHVASQVCSKIPLGRTAAAFDTLVARAWIALEAIVRCKGYNVLDGSLSDYKVVPEVNESNDVGAAPIGPLAAGKWIQMRKNEVIKMEVLIGENPGGHFTCILMIEEQGVEHPPGLFPVFQLRPDEIPQGNTPGHHGSILFGAHATRAGSLLDPIK